jgi:CelD/BcsL family acetyltransferase involved in cellulose biosynthesis
MQLPELNRVAIRAPRSPPQCEWLRSLAQLEGLRSEWDALYQHCASATPFQSPAWVLPWARVFAPDRLNALLLRQEGQLVALLPFFVWRGRVLLAGTGPSDYCDGLYRDERDAQQLLCMLTRCADELGCELIDLQQLPATSALARADVPEHWIADLRDAVACPVAPLEAPDGLGSLSPRWRKNIAAARRKLAREHDLRCSITVAPLCESAAELIARLHAARWSERGGGGIFADPLMRAFLEAVLPELSGAHSLRLHTLSLGEQAIAVALAIRGHQMTCFYIGGFDPRWSRFSPGNITVAAAMSQAAAEGVREFHFLRGDESHKYRFGAQDRSLLRRLLVRENQTTFVSRY